MVVRLVAWRNGAREGRLTGLLGVDGVANLCGEKLEQGLEKKGVEHSLSGAYRACPRLKTVDRRTEQGY